MEPRRPRKATENGNGNSCDWPLGRRDRAPGREQGSRRRGSPSTPSASVLLPLPFFMSFHPSCSPFLHLKLQLQLPYPWNPCVSVVPFAVAVSVAFRGLRGSICNSRPAPSRTRGRARGITGPPATGTLPGLQSSSSPFLQL